MKSKATRNKSKPASAPGQNSQTILLAVSGMSPAILTETIWALAQESPPTIPDQVIVITTLAGSQAIERELLAQQPQKRPSIWQELRGSILGAAAGRDPRLMLASCRIIEQPDTRSGKGCSLEDIQTAGESAATADFILHELRRWVETPSTRIVASIAGGRKTMGALLASCLSLLGRETDRLTHVLVSPPYDHPGLQPRFYFPGQRGKSLRAPDGATVRASQAKIHLADVPFVPLRNLFERDLVAKPASFAELVNRCRTKVETIARQNTKLVIWEGRCEIQVNSARVKTSRREHLLLLFLARHAAARQPPFAKYESALEPLFAFGHTLHAARSLNDYSDWRHDTHLSAQSFGPQELRKVLNELRKKLQQAGPEAAALLPFLPQRGRFCLDLAPDAVSIQP